MNKSAQVKIISIITAVMLLLTYITCGFVVCAGIPMTTEKISYMTSNFEESPYDEQSLTKLALEVRDFTISDYGRSENGQEEAENTLAGHIVDEAKVSSSPDSPTADRWSDEAMAALDKSGNSLSFTETMQQLAEAGEQYSLTDDAISHLNDVNDLVSRLFMPLLGVAVLAAFCLMAGLKYYGYNCVAKSLLYSGCATFIFLLILGIWALVSFDSLFAAFHSLFFAQGTWTFSANSLLIEMYPIDFWIGMGTVWLITSCFIALLSIIFGLLIKRVYKQQSVSKQQKSQQTSETSQSKAEPPKAEPSSAKTA